MAHVLAIALVWGTSFPISKIGINALGPLEFRLAASVISFVVILLVFLRRRHWRQITHSRRWHAVTWLSVVNIAAVPTLNCLALSRGAASRAAILISTMPAIVAGLAWLLDGAMSKREIFALVLSVIGILLVYASDRIVSQADIFIVTSAVIWALGTRGVAAEENNVDMWALTTGQMVIGIPLTWIALSIPFAANVRAETLSKISVSVMASVLCVAISGTVVAYWLWFLAVHKYGRRASYATLISPVISVLISNIWLGERVSPMVWAGLAVVVFSILILLSQHTNITQFHYMMIAAWARAMPARTRSNSAKTPLVPSAKSPSSAAASMRLSCRRSIRADKPITATGTPGPIQVK